MDDNTCNEEEEENDFDCNATVVLGRWRNGEVEGDSGVSGVSGDIGDDTDLFNLLLDRIDGAVCKNRSS